VIKLFVVAGLVLASSAASAQDIRGLEICTAEKDMARRTSCLQSNVELLQQELTKQTRRAQEDRIAAGKELTVLKADIVGLKILLTKAQDEIASLRKRWQDQEKNQEKSQEKNLEKK